MPGVGIGGRARHARGAGMTALRVRRRRSRGHPRRHAPAPAVRPLPRAHQLPVHQAQPALADHLEHADRAQPRCCSCVRGLNLGIDFEGGTSWQVQMADGKRRQGRRRARPPRRRSGFGDAKVSVLTPPGGGQTRAGAGAGRRRPDRRRRRTRSRSTAASRRPRCSSRRRRRRHVHVHREDGRDADRGEGVDDGAGHDRAHEPEGQGRRPATSRSPCRRRAGRARCRRSRPRSRSTRAPTTNDVEHHHRRAHLGSRGEPEGASRR